MGKLRKRKLKKATVTLAGDASDEEEVQVDSKETAIQTIIDQLQSVNVEEKFCGLQTFAHFIETPDNVEQVMNRGLVKVVAPLMMDPVSSVRNAAAGVLRNLSTIRLDVCDAMMDQDAMTPLICYFHEHAETWTPTLNTKTKDDDAETFIHCTNLLMNLCESSELAIKYLGESRILGIMSKYLDLATFSKDIVIAVMQCLFVVVEDNPIAIEKVKTNSERQLQELLAHSDDEPSMLLIKTLAAGVTIKACGGNISVLPINVINQIISILAKTLSIDHRLACNQLSSNVPVSDGAGRAGPPKGKEAKVLDNQMKSVSYMLDAQQTAIEILANICSCDDDDSVSGNESTDSEEMGDEEDCIGEETLLAEDKLPPEVLEAITSLELFDKVWARTELPAANVMLIFKEYEGSELICKKLGNLQTKALLCINNMLSTLPIENLGGVNGVYKIWVDTGKLIFKKDTDLNLVESATAVMRAALDKIKLTNNGNVSECNLFSDLALSDIEMMLTGIKDCQVPEIRSNLIRMIGILALLLVNNLNDTSSNVICTITEFILEQAHKENEVWVLAEAIDTLVDLFSEDETDILAAKVKLVDKLAILAPILKNKNACSPPDGKWPVPPMDLSNQPPIRLVLPDIGHKCVAIPEDYVGSLGKARQQKKLPKEYKVLVTTANSNLPRFIKYKRGRINKLQG